MRTPRLFLGIFALALRLPLLLLACGGSDAPVPAPVDVAPRSPKPQSLAQTSIPAPPLVIESRPPAALVDVAS